MKTHFVRSIAIILLGLPGMSLLADETCQSPYMAKIEGRKILFTFGLSDKKD